MSSPITSRPAETPAGPAAASPGRGSPAARPALSARRPSPAVRR
ncbi:sugar ABC transporter permease, partial [Burkholderia latens]